MIGFVLSLIPGPWLVVLKKLPWRLIGWAALAVVAVVAVLIVNGWRKDSNALEATETRLQKTSAKLNACTARESSAWQALREAEGKAKAREDEDRATAERIENELQTKLADADARGRDLARRLRDAGRAACPGGGAVSGAASVAGAVPDGREPGGDEEARRLAEAIRAAESDVFAACARDGETLSQVGPWYDEARERR